MEGMNTLKTRVLICQQKYQNHNINWKCCFDDMINHWLWLLKNSHIQNAQQNKHKFQWNGTRIFENENLHFFFVMRVIILLSSLHRTIKTNFQKHWKHNENEWKWKYIFWMLNISTQHINTTLAFLIQSLQSAEFHQFSGFSGWFSLFSGISFTLVTTSGEETPEALRHVLEQ